MSTNEPTEQPTLLELASRQIALARKEHAAACLASREKMDEYIAVDRRIRFADHTKSADDLAALMVKRPALKTIADQMYRAEREAEERVRDAENSYAQLEHRVAELRKLIVKAPKKGVFLWRETRNAHDPTRRAQAEHDLRDHEAHQRWLVAELRRHTRKDVEDSSLFAASK